MKHSLAILGNSTQGLWTIRSSASLKLPVFVLHDVYFCSSRFSKYSGKYIKLPKDTIKNLAVSPENNLLTEKLLSLPVEYPSPLFGINEDIINYFVFNREVLCKKYFIPENNYNQIFNKYEFNKLSPAENQIPTFLLEEINLNDFEGGNYILKSIRGNKLRNITGEKAIWLNGLNDSIKEMINKRFSGKELIVQKIIESSYPVTSVCGVSFRGNMSGLFMYEKLRQHPNQFGTGTYLKSMFNRELKEITEIILQKLSYSGIFEIEFILDAEDGKFKAIEMNPRTWKSIGFATMCGQNLVEKYCNYILDKPINHSLDYKLNHYWVDIFTDIPQMIRERKLFGYSKKNLHECIWDSKDPLPFLSSVIFAPFYLFKI